jgi:hypothetical protein
MGTRRTTLDVEGDAGGRREAGRTLELSGHQGLHAPAGVSVRDPGLSGG